MEPPYITKMLDIFALTRHFVFNYEPLPLLTDFCLREKPHINIRLLKIILRSQCQFQKHMYVKKNPGKILFYDV